MLLKLDELAPGINVSKRVQFAKVGDFIHEEYGHFSISLSDLERMKFHFGNNARRQKIDGRPVIPLDYSHKEGEKSAGWSVSLEIDKDENGIDALFGEVEWTPPAAEKIRGREFKFISPSIRRNYKDSETGEIYDVVLKGAALTNVPFLRDMEAIYLLSEDKQNHFMSLQQSGDKPGKQTNGENMTIEELMAALAAMSPEDKKRVFEALAKEMESAVMGENTMLSEKLGVSEKALELSEKTLEGLKKDLKGSTEIADKLKLSETTVTDLSEKVASLIGKMAENDKKSEFDVKLSEGKVCEAQRKSFMSGNISEFMDNAQEIKLSETGDSDKGDDKSDDDKVDKMALAEMAKDSGLDYGTAVSLVLSENPGLRD